MKWEDWFNVDPSALKGSFRRIKGKYDRPRKRIAVIPPAPQQAVAQAKHGDDTGRLMK